MSQSDAAVMLSVGRSAVQQAKQVQEKATPELQAAVELGHIAVSVAAKAAALPAEDQRAIAEKAKAGDESGARTHIKQQARAKKERDLAVKQMALPDKQYGVIVADPEWNFEVWSEKGKDRAAENHYPTSDVGDIKARDVASISADDCVLFLWVTVPMLLQGLEVMKAWGFEYKTNFVWGKNRAGTGYWNRNTHEQLLVGTRGNIPAPAPGTQRHSLLMQPIAEHSAKPELFLQIVEEYFPNLAKIELNCRGEPRRGATKPTPLCTTTTGACRFRLARERQPNVARPPHPRRHHPGRVGGRARLVGKTRARQGAGAWRLPDFRQSYGALTTRR